VSLNQLLLLLCMSGMFC